LGSLRAISAVLSWPKKLTLSFLLGVLTFSPWEILMVRLGVLKFTQSDYWGLAWWAPVAFGLIVMGSVLLFSMVDFLFKIKVRYAPNFLAIEYVILSGFYLSIFFFRQYPYFLTLGLLFVVLVRLIFFHENLDVIYFIFGACIGPTVEIILTSFQLYLFTEPDFLGMPYWLPVFWGNVALALRRVSWVLTPRKPLEAPVEGGLPGQ
jgi:hypothetical protein